MEKQVLGYQKRQRCGDSFGVLHIWGKACENLSTVQKRIPLEKKARNVYPTPVGVCLVNGRYHPPYMGGVKNEKIGQTFEFSPVWTVYPQFFATYPQVCVLRIIIGIFLLARLWSIYGGCFSL